MPNKLHTVYASLAIILIFSLITIIYLVQTENQELKTEQNSTIRITKQESTECLCPVCSTENTTTNTQVIKYSTLSSLFTEYTIEYPIGWHATDSGLGYFDKDEIDTVYVHLNDGPITQVPRGGQLGKIEIIDQSGQIPSLENFLAQKKDLFVNLAEETFTTDSGLTVYKLSGQTNQFEQWIDDVIYCLEYTDKVGDRHLVYTSIQTDSLTIDSAILETMIKSFKIKTE